jgi:hypothetical protein
MTVFLPLPRFGGEGRGEGERLAQSGNKVFIGASFSPLGGKKAPLAKMFPVGCMDRADEY